MIRNFKPARQAIYSRTTLEFGYINDENSGFTFDCDTNGKPVFNTEAAEKSYRYCLDHPELFSVFNECITRNTQYIESATGTCHCGTKLELRNEYRGACECPTCGQWYNLFGQKLRAPDGWDEW